MRWALAQAALFFLAIVFTYSRRSGPLRPLVEPSRLTPLEFVETLGGLYQSAQAAQVAVEVPYQRFQFLLAKRLGLPGRPSASEMAQAATQRLGYKRPEFAATLTRCERAVNNPDLKEKEAVSLVQALNEYARELLLVSPVIEEKN